MNIVDHFKPLRLSPRVSAGLLILRLVAGLAFISHGYGKITEPFAWMPPGLKDGFMKEQAFIGTLG